MMPILRMAFIGLFIIASITLGRAVEKFIWNGKEFTLSVRRAIKEKLMTKYKKPEGDKKIKQKDNCDEQGNSCWEEKDAE